MKWIIRTFFKTVRLIAGPIVLFIDFITSPKGVKRPPEEQAKIDKQVQGLVLYQFRTCPFCIKVKRTNKRLSLNMETRDAQHNPGHREELLKGGGIVKVPCLKINDHNGQTEWMYESDQIVKYLNDRFAA